jgi:hypothetical protein
MTKMQLSAAVICLAASPALGAETIEAIGGEKCGRTSKAYAVDFLAPEDAQVEARGKGMLGNSEEAKADTIGISLDGKPCPTGRCAFRATKGQTYKLNAESTTQKLDSLCISVSRP